VLVLTRKPNEDVVIQLGSRLVRVRVLDAGNGRVRLGIDAPRDVTVHREEVWKCIQQWNEAESAAQCSSEPS
jgi:carbon storage regulator